MVRRTRVVIEDDLTGGPADETVSFGLDGTWYEIDLNTQNAQEMREALSTYIASGRKVTARSPATLNKRRSKATDAKGIREWAAAQGVPVPARGRLPSSVLEAYRKANPPSE